MRIISKFHDYYDSVLKTTGIDSRIIYERKTVELEKKHHEDLWDKKGFPDSLWRLSHDRIWSESSGIPGTKKRASFLWSQSLLGLQEQLSEDFM